MIRAALALLLLAAPAAAGEPLSGAEFRALTEGWTLHFSDEAGEYYGSEQYLPEGRTVWLPRGGRCERGVWAAAEGRICFLYSYGYGCWRVYRRGDEVTAVEDPHDGAPPTRLRLSRRDRDPLLCPEGPGV